jgi:orotate phosphoribosyltransferase
VALGGVPLATAVSLKTEIPLLLVRKDAKAYGTRGRFVGDLEKGDKVILIEDVTTSGGSVLEAINLLRDFGASVDEVITVVDREEGAEANLWNENVTLNPLVKASDLLKEE